MSQGHRRGGAKCCVCLPIANPAGERDKHLSGGILGGVTIITHLNKEINISEFHTVYVENNPASHLNLKTKSLFSKQSYLLELLPLHSQGRALTRAFGGSR